MSGKNQCAGHVLDGRGGGRPCRSKPAKGGMWCRAHNPDAVKAKEEHRSAEARAGWEVYDTRRRAREARDALGQALLEAGRFDKSHAPLAQAYAEALVAWKAAKTALAEKFGKEVI